MVAGISQMISGSGMRILPVALFLLLLAGIARSPAPAIKTEFGGASIEIAADRAWVLLPQGCVTISWQLEGILSIYIDDKGNIGWARWNIALRQTRVAPFLRSRLKTDNYTSMN